MICDRWHAILNRHLREVMPQWTDTRGAAPKEAPVQKIVLIVVVIVLGLLAFNYFTTGELSLMPAERLERRR